jgi:hypothetical protein
MDLTEATARVVEALGQSFADIRYVENSGSEILVQFWNGQVVILEVKEVRW